MGNPLYSDDIGKMCYNPAKNWQIGWYNNNRLELNPTLSSKNYTLVGVADYLNNPDGHPVVVKLETGTEADYFVGFNRAIGANADNVEADDEVTIVQVNSGNGEAYSLSFLKAHLNLNEGEESSYVIPNFGGVGDLTIAAEAIDTTTNPGIAKVWIGYLGCLGENEGLGCSATTICCAGVGQCTGGKPETRTCLAPAGGGGDGGDTPTEAPQSCSELGDSCAGNSVCCPGLECINQGRGVKTCQQAPDP
jgi:hypothetical protein